MTSETTAEHTTIDIIFEEWEHDLDDYTLLMSNALGGFGNQLRIYDKSTGDIIPIVDYYIRIPSVSPDRTRFVYIDFPEDEAYIQIYNLNTHENQAIDVVPLFYDVSPEDRYRADGRPNSVLWLDDNVLLVRMVNMHGSVRDFSEVLYYNLESGNFDRLFVRERYTDFFTDMEWDNDVLKISVIRQCDQLLDVEQEEVFKIERFRIHELIDEAGAMVLKMSTSAPAS